MLHIFYQQKNKKIYIYFLIHKKFLKTFFGRETQQETKIIAVSKQRISFDGKQVFFLGIYFAGQYSITAMQYCYFMRNSWTLDIKINQNVQNIAVFSPCFSFQNLSIYRYFRF